MKLTKTQREVLEKMRDGWIMYQYNIAKGGDSNYLSGTMRRNLIQKSFIKFSGESGFYELTDKGRVALETK